MRRLLVVALLFSGCWFGLPGLATAQQFQVTHTQDLFEINSTPATAGASVFQAPFDERLLRSVNDWDALAVHVWLEGADRSAYPVMFGSVPAWWVASAVSNRVDSRDALGFSVAWMGTAGFVWAGKRLLARPRPYSVLDGLKDRGGRSELDDHSSMPSGHAALSAVTATWLALENPDGAAPWLAGGWAASVAMSRVWKGVHYPSDVIIGMVLGAGAGILVHQLK